MTTEILVCREQEMADGAVRIVRRGELEVAVIRQAGRFYAYRNLCAHQGGPACEGVRMPRVIDVINDEGFYTGQAFDQGDMRIVCPWHGYEYHLETGENVCNSRLRLKKYEVSERDGAVYVSL